MATINDIIAKFDELKPALAADFERQITATLNGLIKRHGANIRKLSSSSCSDGNTFRAYGYKFLTWSDKTFRAAPTGIDTEYLAKQAQNYADDQIAAFTLKLVRKLGALTDVEIHGLSIHAFTFDISGKLGERSVRVTQNRILNVSPKGTYFHQWPALIYVDGKKTPEAAFKKLGA